MKEAITRPSQKGTFCRGCVPAMRASRIRKRMGNPRNVAPISGFLSMAHKMAKPTQLHNPSNWIAELCRIWVPFLQTGSWYYMMTEDPGRGTILKLNSSSFRSTYVPPWSLVQTSVVKARNRKITEISACRYFTGLQIKAHFCSVPLIGDSLNKVEAK